MYLYARNNAYLVRKYVAFYVELQVSVVPRFAFQGQAPDEMYFGTGTNVPVGPPKEACNDASFTVSEQSRSAL